MDKFYLESTLPSLNPTQLTGLKYLGVDEVSRTKGHDYMTVIYDMASGHLIGLETGRTSEVMIRKRARDIQDTDYFKLKIRQPSLPDVKSMLYGYL